MKKLWILPLAAVMMVACGGETEGDDTPTEETGADANAGGDDANAGGEDHEACGGDDHTHEK